MHPWIQAQDPICEGQIERRESARSGARDSATAHATRGREQEAMNGRRCVEMRASQYHISYTVHHVLGVVDTL